MPSDHAALPGTDKPPKNDVTRVADVAPDLAVEVTLTLRGPALPTADGIAEAAVAPDRYAATYGASQDDIDTVTASLQRRGLRVLSTSAETRSVIAEGPARTVEQVFGVQLGTYRGPDEEYRGQEGPVHVPADLAGIVTGVFGLDLRRVAHRRAAPAAPSGSSTRPQTPQDLERRYRFPDGDATGQTVAIAEFGGGYFAEDLRAFCRKYDLPDATQTLTTVSIDQQPVPTLAQIQELPQNRQEAWLAPSVEVMMDIEIVAGLAPGAAISVYFAPFSQKGWVDLLNRALLDKPATLSVSWGSREDDPTMFSAAAVTAIQERLAALAAVGVTVCVSSGDDGSGDNGEDSRCHVDFPAASPFVLGVGGTELHGGEEVVWFDPPGTRFPVGGGPGGGASGGGVSAVIPRPSWQAVTVSRPDGGKAFDGRVVPDVAALAGRPLYDLVFGGQDSPNGGTSASAPLWASLIARAYAASGKKPVFVTPLLYGNGAASAVRDITSGQNASSPNPGVGYAAGTGYDAVTGWGVPVGTGLVALLP